MKRIVLGILSVLMLSGVAGAVLTTQPAMAYTNCGEGKAVLGLVPWYDGMDCINGEIQAPAKGNQEELTRFIWKIILNISFDLSVIIGYLALGIVVYGGYQYIPSQGDPTKATKAKTTLSSAAIGVIITMGASVLVNTAKVVLNLSNGASETPLGDVATRNLVQGAFNYAYSMAGIVAVGFIVKSGIDFMLAKGEPGKVQKAQQGLIYAIVGLVVVILASVITSAVISTVGGTLQ